jgi:hypothetical protein
LDKVVGAIAVARQRQGIDAQAGQAAGEIDIKGGNGCSDWHDPSVPRFVPCQILQKGIA